MSSLATASPSPPSTRVPRGATHLDWLVVGGGVHGVHLAHVLVGRHGLNPDRIRIVDPHAEPLARWHATTAAVGMEYLRSPAVHHVGLEPMDLHRFGTSRRRVTCPPPFEGRYNRPHLAVFADHVRSVFSASGLAAAWRRATVTGLGRRGRAWEVETDRGAMTARRVLLALGMESPSWPPWAERLRDAGGAVGHVLEPGFLRDRLPTGSVAVVGGGISAGQLALALAREGRRVTLLLRHTVRVFEFDSPPVWMGPGRVARFCADPDPVSRRRQITEARHRGSMPEWLVLRLRGAAARGELDWLTAEVGDAVPADGRLLLRLGDGRALRVDGVVLATGRRPDRPGGAWLDAAIAAEGLPVAPCGYPLPDTVLSWAPGLYVTGPLAELQLGPVARNIAGAQRAATRLAAAVD